MSETLLICSRCRASFYKRTAEITFQDKKWVAAGKTLPKPYFCSRLCGQAYSGEAYNHHVTDLKAVAKSLRNRESWKYSGLERKLNQLGIKHRFELPLGGKIFDLAVKHNGVKLLIEFDGDYHTRGRYVPEVDVLKNKIALRKGWTLKRFYHKSNRAVPIRSVIACIESL